MNGSQKPIDPENWTKGQAADLQQLALERLGTREGLEQLTGIVGYKALNSYRKANQANREAEDRAVRRKLDQQGGSTSTDVDLESDTMGTENVVLGGIHNPPAVVYPPTPPSPLLPILAAALAAGIPLAGGAGYLLSHPADPPGQYLDRDIDIGLGRIEQAEPQPDDVPETDQGR